MERINASHTPEEHDSPIATVYLPMQNYKKIPMCFPEKGYIFFKNKWRRGLEKTKTLSCK